MLCYEVRTDQRINTPRRRPIPMDLRHRPTYTGRPTTIQLLQQSLKMLDDEAALEVMVPRLRQIRAHSFLHKRDEKRRADSTRLAAAAQQIARTSRPTTFMNGTRRPSGPRAVLAEADRALVGKSWLASVGIAAALPIIATVSSVAFGAMPLGAAFDVLSTVTFLGVALASETVAIRAWLEKGRPQGAIGTSVFELLLVMAAWIALLISKTYLELVPGAGWGVKLFAVLSSIGAVAITIDVLVSHRAMYMREREEEEELAKRIEANAEEELTKAEAPTGPTATVGDQEIDVSGDEE